ncbi:hypothetical protein FJN13_07765 [Alteromonas mediterranea]|uniref:Uncharacterized protein n=1 Tax=Alteromonas mediterranea TaxID=314275 RepID=A0AAC9JBX9_9ALTE|nr:hypothetical protein BM524_08040 [Alteromonas mediterranea]APD97556.1 hypothetical protein BM525_08005 [Alteromonas mediterranea]APE01796.1 hypothetical protein BM526_08045 [Alteromonas mediterranea]QDG34691.1 hypothetical protein FJN13_07765 [Alteromonas mediterranea]QDG38321.1 hypothetical protein FJN14_07645 [Alteromonas mediterranea]
MGKKDRIRPPKPCDICSKEADVQFRIQTNESGNWRIVCKSCQEQAASSAGYLYGGTWKRKKRN